MVGVAAALLYGAVVNLEQQSVVFQNRIQDTGNVLGRLATYRQGLEVFAAHPLFGVGVGQCTNAVLATPTVAVGGYTSVPEPHSSYVDVLTEQGIVGFLPLLAVTVAVWWLIRALRRRATSRADLVLAHSVGAASLAFLVMSLTLEMIIYEPSNAIMAVLLGAVRRARRRVRAHCTWERLAVVKIWLDDSGKFAPSRPVRTAIEDASAAWT